MKTIVVAVSLIICAPLLAQQANTKPKSSKPKPTSAADSAPTLAPAPKPEPESTFTPVVFSKNLPVTAYIANDPIKVYEWVVAKIESLPGKPDEFSTSDEKRSYEALVADQMNGIGQIPMIGNCIKKYDGDRQQYEIKASVRPLSSTYGLKAIDAKSINLRVITLKLTNLKQETYTAQNGYGAETQVSKSTSDNYAIAFPYSMSPTTAIIPGVPRLTNLPLPYELDFGYLKFDVPMESADARLNDKDLSCLFIFSFSPPFAFKHTERSAPSRTLPYENVTHYHAVFGKLDQVLVVNKATGALYDQAARP